ncbi:MAG: hypothetical protein WA937_02730 [Flavobacteriales bacterium]
MRGEGIGDGSDIYRTQMTLIERITADQCEVSEITFDATHGGMVGGRHSSPFNQHNLCNRRFFLFRLQVFAFDLCSRRFSLSRRQAFLCGSAPLHEKSNHISVKPTFDLGLPKACLRVKINRIPIFAQCKQPPPPVSTSN